MQHQWIIVSVGGSLIAPDEIDIEFVASLKDLITTHVAKGTRFVIITGGGKTARRYQQAAASLTPLTSEDLDWLGIHATRLNGHLLRTIFKDLAYPTVIKRFDEIDTATEAPVIIAAGDRPGHSTDYDAVAIAETLGATSVVNLSDTDYIYDSDPHTNPNATPFKKIDWATFRTLIPETWDPGLSSPFDPIAAQKAQELGLEVAQINGKTLHSFDAYLANEDFTGTRIHP